VPTGTAPSSPSSHDLGSRIRIVLEQQDISSNAVFPQAHLGLVPEIVDDPLTRLVVDDELGDVIALGRRVLGVEPDVEVEARAVLEEDVRVAGARDSPSLDERSPNWSPHPMRIPSNALSWDVIACA